MEAVSFIVPGPRHCHRVTFYSVPLVELSQSPGSKRRQRPHFSWEGVSNHFGALQCLSDAMV